MPETAAKSPLSPTQQRAAALIGAGWTSKDAAREVGVTPRTMSRWAAREDFQGLVRQARSASLDQVPTARSTLEAALGATRPNGTPDWAIRVSAARALVGADGPADPRAEERPTVIHDDRLADGEGAT